MRAELGCGPVTVTTVVPGLMRTGSHLQARFTGQAGKEFTWFALRASLPLISMDAERAARQLISAVRQREPEIILTPAVQIVSRVAGLAPGLTSEVLTWCSGERSRPRVAGPLKAASPSRDMNWTRPCQGRRSTA